MIEPNKNVGSHDDQRRAALIQSLREAGIGQAYADRSLGDTETGQKLKDWLLTNRLDVMGGAGFDFRGESRELVDLVNMTGRSLILMGLYTQLIPLVRLPKLLREEETAVELRRVGHLIIRDFETSHENPLRAYEIAEIEALIEDRMNDNKGVSVVRKGGIRGWWSATTELYLENANRTVEVA